VDQAEGYIKFTCQLVATGPVIPEALFTTLNAWRDRLYSLHLLGVNEQGIGFGNLSARRGNSSQFYISGSATGKHRHAEPRHYALVTTYNFSHNTLTCQGSVKASSESLSHAAIYEADENVHSVVHVHHRKMWEYGMTRLPCTDPSCSFGTPEIAENIFSLLQRDQVRRGGILIMGGHPEGVLFFGHSPEETGNKVLEFLAEVTNQ
jgi:hypothetical protein